jgi:sporulation protein YlmC with PRC-barrel domain
MEDKMNFKKLNVCLVTLHLLNPVLLPAEQTQESDRVLRESQQPSSAPPVIHRLENLVDISIVLPISDENPEQSRKHGPEQNSPDIPESTLGERKEIGEIVDLIINAKGDVTYVMLDLNDNKSSWDWWTGIGLYLIPAEAFTEREEQQDLLFDSQQVQEKNIIKVQDEDLLQKYLLTDSVRASQLKDFKVVDINNVEFSSLEDLVINMSDYKVVYLALSIGSFRGVGNKLYAIPFDDIKLDMVQERIQIDVAHTWFENKSGFDPEQWPESADVQ